MGEGASRAGRFGEGMGPFWKRVPSPIFLFYAFARA